MIDFFLKRVNKKIKDLNLNNKDICVLKGIPISLVDRSIKIDISQIILDKLNYFMKIVYDNRKFITYEEFILLYSFIDAQYNNIYILDNNIYMTLYPIERLFSEEVERGLLRHYNDNDDINADAVVGNIEEFESIYNGIKSVNGKLVGSYFDEPLARNNKIRYINLFTEHSTVIGFCEKVDMKFIDIVDESDYITFVDSLFEGPSVIICRISNYTGDKTLLRNRIEMISYYWSSITRVSYLQLEENGDDFNHRAEYTEYLKEYWGYDSFRNLSMYDICKLEEGIKETKPISQERIISDLVVQTENAIMNRDFRDIFVTAPTGAGKSIMFQIPAMYLAEKYNLLTIVISPLIGLMNDQVKNLQIKNYKNAVTINSDISPIIKSEITNKVANSDYHILYISPETLLSRSDIENLIGDREIGMIIIDEAHIVTTWGKQFRPDYWYLGDHIRKLRKQQIEKKGKAFVISTFTATAIYHGIEDMYDETINSLHMLNPITYLGYIKRKNVNIIIRKKEKLIRSEYELDKFIRIEELIKRSKITNKKILIYFPTISLINRCYDYLQNKHMVETVCVYFGTLSKEQKQENYEKFLDGEKKVMLATKAFGMGIDINDIEIIYHFAPTGNVCDYVQEIGRVARRSDLQGEALYDYDTRDFKHINRLYGLSTIKKYQLIEVIRKIDELFSINLHRKRDDFTKRRNAMLLDAENFTYIFGKSISDETENINKVKTALLIIQKDFENKIGFSPITVRPVPLFSIGFFKVNKKMQNKLLKKYPNCLKVIDEKKDICRMYLDTIWNKSYNNYSFPKFKYLLYSKSEELAFNKSFEIIPALCVSVEYANNYGSRFESIWNIIKSFIHKKVMASDYISLQELINELTNNLHISKYKAQTLAEVLIASMDLYRKKFSRGVSPIIKERTTNEGITKYQFNVAVNSFINWVDNGFKTIVRNTNDGKLYLINDNTSHANELNSILGLLESMSVLSFEVLGGTNSQLYIYVNQIQALKNILNNPSRYENRLLNTISNRHLISVKMLTYLYESDMNSSDIWDTLEDYFLGKIPNYVKESCIEENNRMQF